LSLAALSLLSLSTPAPVPLCSGSSYFDNRRLDLKEDKEEEQEEEALVAVKEETPSQWPVCQWGSRAVVCTGAHVLAPYGTVPMNIHPPLPWPNGRKVNGREVNGREVVSEGS